MRVVVAPDKFRGSLTAVQAADAIAAGLLDAVPDADVRRLPVADGGEGTLDALAAAGWTVRPVDVAGPTGAPVRTRILRRGSTAAVELADCCGRPRLPGGVTAPTTATTAGLGDALLAAVRDGAQRVVLAVGGSASTDGGLGMLRVLGVRVLDDRGRAIVAPLELARAASIDTSGLVAALAGVQVGFAVDVHAPLLGPSGAARLFGPQKGATPEQVSALEAALTRWAAVLAGHAGRDVATVPGAGAAGGVVAGVLGALAGPVTISSGAGFVLDAVGLPAAVRDADAVVVGEGRLDAQSLLGKAPVEAARIARAGACRVVAVVGSLDLDSSSVRAAGIETVLSLRELARADPDAEHDAERDAAVLARHAGALIGRALGDPAPVA